MNLRRGRETRLLNFILKYEAYFFIAALLAVALAVVFSFDLA